MYAITHLSSPSGEHPHTYMLKGKQASGSLTSLPSIKTLTILGAYEEICTSVRKPYSDSTKLPSMLRWREASSYTNLRACYAMEFAPPSVYTRKKYSSAE